MALRPSDPTPWFRLSDNRYYEGRFEESEEAARRAIELGSRAGATFWNLMVALNSQGKYDAAREAAVLADSLGASTARVIAWMTAWAAGDIEEIRRLGEDLPPSWNYIEHWLRGRLDTANAVLMDLAADYPTFRPLVPIRLAAEHLFIRGGELAAGDDDGIGALADQALAGMPETAL